MNLSFANVMGMCGSIRRVPVHTLVYKSQQTDKRLTARLAKAGNRISHCTSTDHLTCRLCLQTRMATKGI